MTTLDSAIDLLRRATGEVQRAIQTLPNDLEPFYAGYLIAAVSQLMDIQAKLIPTIKELYPPLSESLPAVYQELRQQKNLP
jgi:hypothetical protein